MNYVNIGVPLDLNESSPGQNLNQLENRERINNNNNKPRLPNPLNELAKLRPGLSYQFDYSPDKLKNISHSCKVIVDGRTFTGLGGHVTAAKYKCVYQVLRVLYPEVFKKCRGECLTTNDEAHINTNEASRVIKPTNNFHQNAKNGNQNRRNNKTQTLLCPINELQRLNLPNLEFIETEYPTNRLKSKHRCEIIINQKSYFVYRSNVNKAKRDCAKMVLKFQYPKVYKIFEEKNERIKSNTAKLHQNDNKENDDTCKETALPNEVISKKSTGETDRVSLKRTNDSLIIENEKNSPRNKIQKLYDDHENKISDNKDYGQMSELLKLRPDLECIETMHPNKKHAKRHSCEIKVDKKLYKRFGHTVNRARKACAQLVLRQLYPEIYKNKDPTDLAKLNTEINTMAEESIDEAVKNTSEQIFSIHFNQKDLLSGTEKNINHKSFESRETLTETGLITDLPTPSQEIEAQETTKDSFGEIKQLMSSIDSIMEIETIEKLIEDQLRNNTELNHSNANLLITLYKSTNHIWPIHGRNPESIQLNILSLLFDYLNKHRIHPELIADYIIALSDAVKAKTTNINLIQDLIHRLNKLVTVIQINEFKEIIYHENLLPVLLDILKNKRISTETNECCADLLLKLSDNIKVRSFLRRNQEKLVN